MTIMRTARARSTRIRRFCPPKRNRRSRTASSTGYGKTPSGDAAGAVYNDNYNNLALRTMTGRT